MAICPKCKKQVSEAAVVCPHCECNIEEFKNNIKAEKERAAAERAEKARLAAEEERKAKELADRLICPDCKTAVTLSDKTCPKCGFPLDDKGERLRMELWHDVIEANKPTFKNTWRNQIITGALLMFFLWDICREDFLILKPVIIEREILISPKFDILGLPFLIVLFAFILSVYTSIKRQIDYDAAKDNYETFMIKRRYITKDNFVDRIKRGIAHCPYCKRRMTEKSFAHYPNRDGTPSSYIYAICCEHCEKFLKFPGDDIRKHQEERHRKSQARKERWGF